MWDNQLTCNFVHIVKKKQVLILKQESVRKSNRSCKGSLGFNWLDRWVADMPWESPTNLSDSAKKIDRIVSEHDKALVMKKNFTTRVFGRPPPMSSSATSYETSSTSQSPFPLSWSFL